MIPTTALALLSFFVLVAPGLLFDLLLSKKQAERSETAFREAGRVVLVSAWCSLVSVPIVLGVGAALRAWAPNGQDWVPTARDLVIGERVYLADHLAGISLTGVLFVATSLAVSKLTYWVIYRADPGQVSQVSVWRKVFRDDAPPGASPLVRVKMQSGTSWSGRVAHYSPDLEIADREIVLSSPIAMKGPSGKSNELSGNWSRVILRGDQIDSIAVQYQAHPSGR
ncbi:DUF6338 family protein [Dietzia cercidiphylli]|uniref:DUF6338 family protein n=1 Tax=Dietzia cercidiphylli TaxID=498199 RepID=UPI003F8018A8